MIRTEERRRFSCLEGLGNTVLLLTQREGFVAVENNFANSAFKIVLDREPMSLRSDTHRLVPPRSRAKNVLQVFLSATQHCPRGGALTLSLCHQEHR